MGKFKTAGTKGAAKAAPVPKPKPKPKSTKEARE